MFKIAVLYSFLAKALQMPCTGHQLCPPPPHPHLLDKILKGPYPACRVTFFAILDKIAFKMEKILVFCTFTSNVRIHWTLLILKVHKNENFIGFDFEFCTISLLVMSKY